MGKLNKENNSENTKKTKTRTKKTPDEKKELKKQKKAKKAEKKKNQSKAKKILKRIGLVILILCILGGIVCAGLVAGLFMGLLGDDFLISDEELTIKVLNTYFYDSEGNQIAMINAGENRMVISYSDMNPMLPQAFIAIEDERYDTHNGVDVKRTAAAVMTFVTNKGSSSFGGSTITQQLVKNLTEDKEDSGLEGVIRKVKEMSKAIQVEKKLTKSQIMELYLNILFLGGDVHGVQTASYYYFNKSAAELSLEECAFLAGITHTPNAYNPYKEDNSNAEKIKTRTKTVLRKMLELGKINDEEYNTAVANVEEGLKFEKGEIVSTATQTYFVEAAFDDVVKDLMEEKKISKGIAQTMVYTNGYHIHTTQVVSIQNEIDTVYMKDSYFETSKASGAMSQSGMAIVDYTKGYVVGIAGGRGEKQTNREWNRAIGTVVQDADGAYKPENTVRPTGSTMKPLSVYAPAIEYQVITAGSVYDDAPRTYRVGGDNYTPKNYYSGYRGLSTVRYAIEISQNIVPVEILYDLGIDRSYEFLQSLGVSSLVDADRGPSALALGGLTYGISPLEMAAAYGTIANNGKYIAPKFYTKVTDYSGKTVLTPKQEERQVMSTETAYIMQNLLTQPVIGSEGTARYCAISGIDVAAKTGTTNKDNDRWLCGFTPYYSAATWYGFDIQETVKKGGTNPAGKIWSDIMKAIHKGLEGKKFIRPETVVGGTVCRDSGMAMGELCTQDARGSRAVSDIFIRGTVPTKACDKHVRVAICNDTGLLASEFCPNVSEVVKVSRGDAKYNWSGTRDAANTAPTVVCTTHTTHVKEPDPVTPEPENPDTPKSDNAKLKSLEVTGYTFKTTFASGTLSYELSTKLAHTVNSIDVKFQKENENQKVSISGDKNLKDGVNTVTVTVTAEDGKTSNVYVIKMEREADTSGGTNPGGGNNVVTP